MAGWTGLLNPVSQTDTSGSKVALNVNEFSLVNHIPSLMPCSFPLF